MIVVIEGPSAAGKTTWATAAAGRSLVPELALTVRPPDESGAAAAFWTGQHAERWSQALALECQTGLAVLDTDPLKLHYAWSLERVGAGSGEDRNHQEQAYRGAIAAGRIGFADRYLVSIPSAAELRGRREADVARRRRNFELHVRLAQPLREWYAALDEIRPGSVIWSFSPAALTDPVTKRDRYNVADFDALMERLRRALSPT